jgi:glycosyltransferase involved in cell wall biosynthesis
MILPHRILQVFTVMNRGGAETMIMNYYRHMDLSKIQFDFLVHRSERGAYDDEIESLGGKIYRIPPVFKTGAHHKAVKQFFTDYPAYPIVHGHVGELGYFIYKEAKHQANHPFVIAHAHNAACDKNWKFPLRLVMKHLIRPYCDHFMTCGDEAAQWMFGRKPFRPLSMLNNAIDSQLYRFNEEKRHNVRHGLGWENHIVIGDVARFSPQKNHSFLLDVFASVLSIRHDALLVLIGDKSGLYDDVFQKAERLGIADKVQFLGMRTDIPDLMLGMDVYCSPSLYEGLSVSMVEAQASGLRIITSDRVPRQVSLCSDLVRFLPLSADSNSWVQALLMPYERRDTYQEMCQAGFDIHENSLKLQNFYLEHASCPR